jgi:hypothetical protein
MDISGFCPPDYGLIDSDPLGFKQQFQAFVDSLAAPGDLERVNAELSLALEGANRQCRRRSNSPSSTARRRRRPRRNTDSRSRRTANRDWTAIRRCRPI